MDAAACARLIAGNKYAGGQTKHEQSVLACLLSSDSSCVFGRQKCARDKARAKGRADVGGTAPRNGPPQLVALTALSHCFSAGSCPRRSRGVEWFWLHLLEAVLDLVRWGATTLDTAHLLTVDPVTLQRIPPMCTFKRVEALFLEDKAVPAPLKYLVLSHDCHTQGLIGARHLKHNGGLQPAPPYPSFEPRWQATSSSLSTSSQAWQLSSLHLQPHRHLNHACLTWPSPHLSQHSDPSYDKTPELLFPGYPTPNPDSADRCLTLHSTTGRGENGGLQIGQTNAKPPV
jgi:hypothetical protein